MSPILRKFWLLLRRNRFQSDLAEEMAYHRAEAEKAFVASGMTPRQAQQAAKRQIGNELKIRDQSHAIIGFRLETVWQDVRYAVRQMFRAPGFTLAVVLTLALGIGANTAIFSVVQAMLLRPLPYPGSEQIVRIEDVPLKGVSVAGLTGLPRAFDLQARSKSFQSITLMYVDSPTLIVNGQSPEQLDGAAVSGQFWRVFPAQPLLGRVFDERDDQANSAGVAVLSYAAWQRIFHGDPTAVGKAVTIDQQSTTIIGVMPQSFDFPTRTDVWKPAQLDPAKWNTYRGDGTRWANVYARLKIGEEFSSAESELQGIALQLAGEHPLTDGAWRFRILPLRDYLFRSVKPALLVLFSASGILLLIACLNVGSLMLSRATARQREVALRQALGASRLRVLRQLLTESALLSMLGGSIGLAIACGLVRLSSTALPGVLSSKGAVALDWPVVAFALGVSLFSGSLLALVPAMSTHRGDLNRTLKTGESRIASNAGNRLRSGFVAVQVGLSLVLLVSACLLAQSLWKLTRSPLGFVPDHVLTFELKLPWSTEPVAADNFFTNVQRRIESLPGVTAAGQTSALPTVQWQARSSYDVDWKPRTAQKDAITVEDLVISGDYLRAMRIPLVAGRELRPKDTGLLVNREFVRRYLPGANPLGKHILRPGGNGQTESREIVGVIGDVRGTAGSISRAVEPEVYETVAGYQVRRSFAVRSAIPPEQLVAAIRNQVHEVDAQQAIGNITTLDEMLSMNTARPRLNMALLAAFAAIALALACVGIYGVVAYSVAQRQQEIGVRMALGATRSQIVRHFLNRSMIAALFGLAGGTVAAVLLTRLLRSQLYGVSPNDPRTFALSTLLLLIPVLLASLRPALKAATVNPVEALRAE